MKNLFKLPIIVVLVSMLFLLTGCPYSATVPIDEPTIAINNKLLGKWIKKSKFGNDKLEEANYLVFEKATANTYKISKFDWNSEEKKHKLDKTYEGHFSKVGKYDFFNMKNDGNYYFYKVELKDDIFTMFEVTDNIDEKFQNSADLKAFFKKHADLSFFYNKDEENYVREK
jgi:hypothetical protein